MRFETPTQVKYWDEGYYVGGIAYQDYIICGCCGGLMDIDEIIEFGTDAPEGAIVSLDWIDIEHEIKGE